MQAVQEAAAGAHVKLNRGGASERGEPVAKVGCCITYDEVRLDFCNFLQEHGQTQAQKPSLTERSEPVLVSAVRQWLKLAVYHL